MPVEVAEGEAGREDRLFGERLLVGEPDRAVVPAAEDRPELLRMGPLAAERREICARAEDLDGTWLDVEAEQA